MKKRKSKGIYFMQEIRLALVGAGHRGRHMFQTGVNAAEKIIPAAACDINPDLWYKSQNGQKAMAEIYPDTAFYEDFQTMLNNEKIDVLLVETPAHIHTAFCAEGLNRNINVLSDIPLVRSTEEADMLWEAGKKSKATLMTGANPNEWGFIEALYDLFQQGLLGRPFYLEAEYIHDVRYLWKETPWRSKGMPIRYCTHSLGPLLRLLPNDELRRVSCVTTGPQIVGGEGQNDLMTAHFTTPKNVVVRFTASFINEAKCGHHSYRVFGTEGYFERLSERGKYPARSMFNSKKLYGAGQLTELPIDMTRPDFADASRGSGHGGADFMLFHDFFHALRTGDMSKVITLREGIRMSVPGLFAAESATLGGQAVDIHYPWDKD